MGFCQSHIIKMVLVDVRKFSTLSGALKINELCHVKFCRGGKISPLLSLVLWLGLRVKLAEDRLAGEKHKKCIWC